MIEPLNKAMQLQFPQHLGEFPTYEEAQAAVDYLSDQKFPVENVMIVGTNLKVIERVTGRRTWATVIGEGVVSGIISGLFVGLMLMMFVSPGNFSVLLVGFLMGIVFGIIARALSYAMSGGKRDFNSARQIVASSFEVLAEHKVAQEARDLLAKRPEARAAMFE